MNRGLDCRSQMNGEYVRGLGFLFLRIEAEVVFIFVGAKRNESEVKCLFL